VFITPTDDESLRGILAEIGQAGGRDLKVYADVVVSTSADTDFRSDTLVFGGIATELVDLPLQLAAAGHRQRPAATRRAHH
jgi:hypothetical protein